MNDKGKIIAGVIVFFALVTFPFWFSMGKAEPKPEPVLTPKALEAKACVRDKAWINANHMQLLNEWRDAVVRNGERMYVNLEGKSFDMSLSNTCLDCHSNKVEFCDRCHNYAAVSPYCWDCHIENPKETK
jgi:hypothetical protein